MKNGIYKSRDSYCDDGIACLRMYNIEAGQIVWKDIKRMRLSKDEVREYGLLPGDILVNRVNSRELVGKAAAIRPGLEECVFESKNIRVRLKTNLADSRFVSFALQANGQSHFTRNAQQVVGMASISQPQVAAFPLPLPPLDEQQRIVAEIEKQFTRLEAGVASMKRVQAALKRYRASVLKAACEGRLVPTEAGWSSGVLGDVLTGIEAGKSFKCEERPPEADEIGVVKVSAVTWGIYDERETKTCVDSARVERRYLVKQGDFLFSRANTIELIGACLIVHTVSKQVMLSDKILRFRFNGAVMPGWILMWLRSEVGRREIERLSTGNQESMRNIGQDRIRQITLKIPPLNEQHRIVAEVDRRLSVIAELEAVVAANLKRATHLRQSILHRAFAGKLI